MDNITVSVIIPTYNRGALVGWALGARLMEKASQHQTVNS